MSRKNLTGTYAWRNGQFVKISDKVPIMPKFCYIPPESKLTSKGFYDIPSGKVFHSKREKLAHYSEKGLVEV